VHTRTMDGLDAGVFSGGGLFLICSSTYGQGDVPDNAKNLYESLNTARPDLSTVRYGVIALVTGPTRKPSATVASVSTRSSPSWERGASARSCCTTRARAPCRRKSRRVDRRLDLAVSQEVRLTA